MLVRFNRRGHLQAFAHGRYFVERLSVKAGGNGASHLNERMLCLVEKGLVVVTSGNEDAADCVRAAQTASEIRDVHAIIGMNVGANNDPANARSILSELLEYEPVHVIVSDDIVGASRNLDDGKSVKKIANCSTSTRIVFRT